jgi:hypothetical protein
MLAIVLLSLRTILDRRVQSRSVPMASHDPIAEFRNDWLPNVTDDGLGRVLELLKKASPLLIHGAFTRAVPMGCLASHIAWNHPRTCRLSHEAGIVWLAKVAGLNPATSAVILAWDRNGVSNFELRTSLIAACQDELDRREAAANMELEATMA